MSRVSIEYSELSASTKFSCIECTNTAKVSLTIIATYLCYIAYCYIFQLLIDTSNSQLAIAEMQMHCNSFASPNSTQ